jgi:signal peptide peptidase-like protein 2B
LAILKFDFPSLLSSDSSSVMIGVATGKGAPRNGTEDSEPTETLPMLLKVPMMLDWGGGVTLLGLGDIVLPGLLLSFALRADYMKRASSKWGYYWLMCAGYWLGLIVAIAASRIMQQVEHPQMRTPPPIALGVPKRVL